MPDQIHIVIVDDHSDIRDLVGAYLSQHGYRVSLADGGPALRQILDRSLPDLVILDIMMPGEDGLEICRSLRVETQLPIIFLTAVADDTERIIGLELGADDYVTKSFNPRELLARVRAVLRRAPDTPRKSGKRETVRFDQWTLDLGRRELTNAGGLGVAQQHGGDITLSSNAPGLHVSLVLPRA